MNVNKNTPDIRFSGFGGNWDKKKLAELVQPVSSYPLSRGVEVNEDTKYRYIHYGDIHRGKLKVIKSEKQLSNIHMGNYELLEKGDLVVADASEDYEGIANPCVLDYELQDKVVAGLHTIAMRPINIDPLYLYNLFHTDLFKSHGRFIGTGTKVFGISAKNLLRFESFVPELNEQAAIGSFFQHIDETIALSRRKHEKTKTLKNAFLSKMFPQPGKDKPEIRLKGFSGDWVEKQLGDLSTVQMCKRIFKHETKETGQIPFYKIGTFGGVADAYIETALYEDYKKKYPYPQASDILISASGTIGRLIIYSGENAYYQDSNIIWLNIDKLQLVNSFLFYFYQTVKWNKVEGSTIKRLYNSDILSTSIKIPKIEEQAAIGQLFKQLDDTLALQAKQLKALESLKKALLAKMFV